MAITARAATRQARAALREAGLMLASTGRPFSPAAIDLAAGLAKVSGSRVRVVTVARIHGSAFGLQHPGLMPNKKEKAAAEKVVADAIRALQRQGLAADGEVVITRNPGAAFARAARSAGRVTDIVVDEARGGRRGRLSAGGTVRAVRLRVKGAGVRAVSGGVVHGG
jgi:nucleotide-binding universal stress UspA family protein